MNRTYTIEGGLLRFEFDYDQKIIYDIKQLKDRWYDPKSRCWFVPFERGDTGDLLKFIEKYNFTKAKWDTEECKLSDADITHITNSVMKTHNFTLTPRRYQIECLDYLLSMRKVIIGDDVGLGKTFEAIMGIEVQKVFPCLVITPSSVKYNWAERWEEYTGRTNISVIESGKNKKRYWGADVVIINYDILGKMTNDGFEFKFPEIASIPWKSVICDESHFLKNKKSTRSYAVAKLVKAINTIYFLTGTAIMNRPAEIINQLQLLGKLAEFGNWMYFVKRYCNAKKTPFGWDVSGASHLMELNKKLKSVCYIRREKKDVIKELPIVTEQIFKVDINNKKKYASAETDLLNYLRGEYGTEASENAEKAQELVLMNTLKQLSGKGKLSSIEKYLKDWIEADNGKLLVFGTHRHVLEHLSDKFNANLLDGSLSSKQKHDTVNRFKSTDNPLLFANIQSGGTGIDGLQSVCNNVLFIELPWRPSDVEQAVGRISRQGQQLPVTVTYALCPYTIDIDIWDMIQEKRAVTDAVNKGIDVESDGDGIKKVLQKLVGKNT